MWIERVRAIAFGPLVQRDLELRPGLNVVVGPNESGKSSWHAALFAALCGMRRSRGGLRKEDRDFATKHRPWDGPSWRASAILHLADGRRIEIEQDLDGRVDCRATDLTGGRDVSGQIMNDGSPDAAIWLGLDRTSFLATACVRQADVLAVQSSAGAIQEALQRAAASAAAESTASQALALLDEFEQEDIGTSRAPTKPLRTAMARVETARAARTIAETEHAKYIALGQQADEARDAVATAERRQRAARAAIALHQAEALEARLAEARRLLGKLPAVELPLLNADDAGEVATLLGRWQQRPVVPSLEGESAASIRERIAQLTVEGDGDRAMHESVTLAFRSFSERSAVLRQFSSTRPVQPQPPETGGASPDELYELAAALDEPAPVLRQRRSFTPAWVAGVAVLAIAGVGAFAGGLPVLGAVALAVAATVAALRFLLPARTNVPSGKPSNALPVELRDRGLPATPDELRVLAWAAADAARRQEDVAAWEDRQRDLQAEQTTAAEALRDALVARDAALRDAPSLQAAFETYERSCRQRQDAWNLLQTAEVELRSRVQNEAAYSEAAATIATLEADLRRLAQRLAIPCDGTIPADEVAAQLTAWAERYRAGQSQREEQQRKRNRLEYLLDGRTVEELDEAAKTARDEAASFSAQSISPEDVDEMARWLAAAGENPVREQLAAEERDARDTLIALEQQLSLRAERMPDVAAAQEELATAEADLRRLQELADVVHRTRDFLKSAVDRAHRTIAPVLQATVATHLAAVTHGRYTDALVDPEDLEVKVRADGQPWRSAASLSHGTAEQVYLLLRVALAEHLVRSGETTPLILDDVTVHSDATRTGAILEALLKLAESHQVILFTQEAEVADWARARLDGDAHQVVDLPQLPVAS